MKIARLVELLSDSEPPEPTALGALATIIVSQLRIDASQKRIDATQRRIDAMQPAGVQIRPSSGRIGYAPERGAATFTGRPSASYLSNS